MKNKAFKQISESIKKANSIALFCHISPDFDAYSSMYALHYALTKMGKKVNLYTHEKLKSNYKTLLDEKLLHIGGFESQNYDLLISVDVPNIKRLGIYGEQFLAHENTIMLDHHLRELPQMAKIAYIDKDFSSCAEIVYDLIKYMKIKIDKALASYLYIGLSSDTHSFRNSNINEHSYMCGLELYKLGAEVNKINVALYKQRRKEELALQKIFYNQIEMIDNKFAVSLITMEDFKKTKTSKQDCETFSTDMLSYENIFVTCSIVQRGENNFDGSFRAKPGYDVSIIASELGGGGHKEASGCKFIAKNPQSAKKLVISTIRKHLKGQEK